MYQEKRSNAYKIIMTIIVTAFITCIATIIGFTQYLKKDGNIKYIVKSIQGNDLETEILKIRAILDDVYLNDIDEQKLIDGAIKGYVDALGDKYTKYLIGTDWEKVEQTTTGYYVGIGIYISIDKETNEIIILAPMVGTPAEEAGIKSGDVLLKINGVEYNAETVDEATDAIKGEVGTKVKIEIKREDEILTFEVERKNIRLNKVISQIINEDIGYILLSSFDEGVAEDFKQVAQNLIDQGIDKFIIDVRGNTGGVVTEALQIAEYLIPKDKTLMITIDKDKNKKITKSILDNFITGEVVLLTNGNSASATEILTAAIKDNKRGTIIGTKTYGKGVMQQIVKISDDSALKITTEEFYTPNGDKIDGVGIIPDEEIKLISDKEGNLYDTQLKRAVELLS